MLKRLRPLFIACQLAGGASVHADEAVRRMPLAEFEKLHRAGEVVALDVRSAEEFRDAHIPGALSMPLSAVAARVAELKGVKKPIVAYCT